jgi:hypothetical protein
LASSEVAKWFAAVLGAVLVLVGLLGFIQNPIVGEPDWNPLFVTGTVHNIVHIVTGAVALFIAFGLTGLQRAIGLIAFGLAYGGVLLLTLVSPELFGLFHHPVNAADHALHLALAVAPIAIGAWAYMDSSERQTTRR